MDTSKVELDDLFGSDPSPSRATISTGIRSTKVKLPPVAPAPVVALKTGLSLGSSWNAYPPYLTAIIRSQPVIGPSNGLLLVSLNVTVSSTLNGPLAANVTAAALAAVTQVTSR